MITPTTRTQLDSTERPYDDTNGKRGDQVVMMNEHTTSRWQPGITSQSLSVFLRITNQLNTYLKKN